MMDPSGSNRSGLGDFFIPFSRSNSRRRGRPFVFPWRAASAEGTLQWARGCLESQLHYDHVAIGADPVELDDACASKDVL